MPLVLKLALISSGVCLVLRYLNEQSPDDVMEEFAKLGEECKVLNVQVAEKNKKLEKMSVVLASMERALVESEYVDLVLIEINSSAEYLTTLTVGFAGENGCLLNIKYRI